MATQIASIKWLPSASDKRFMVDGFNFKCSSCRSYFLTHYHSDHTCGLSRGFNMGTIYCSEITARLLINHMGMSPDVICAVSLYTPVIVEGCKVTFLCANHCPGAVMLLVEVPQQKGRPKVILHTGDCRWDPTWMAAQIPPHLPAGATRVDEIFLDTTYCLPRHTFPPQRSVIQGLVQEVLRLDQQQQSQHHHHHQQQQQQISGVQMHLQKQQSQEQQPQQTSLLHPSTLVVVAAYRIGKEKVFFSLAKALGVKIWCSATKRQVLAQLGIPASDWALLTNDPAQAQLHVVGWGIKPEALHKHYLSANHSAPAFTPAAHNSSVHNSNSSLSRERWEEECEEVEEECEQEGEWEEEHSDLMPGVLVRGCEAEERDEAGECLEPFALLPQQRQQQQCCEQILSHQQSGSEQQQQQQPQTTESEQQQQPAENEQQGVQRGKWQRVIGIRPTGWSYRPRARSLFSQWKHGQVTVIAAPYSEHSSFAELCECIKALRPSRITPTVNADSPAKVTEIIDRFTPFMDLSRNRSRLDMYLVPKAPPSSTTKQDPVSSQQQVSSVQQQQQQQQQTRQHQRQQQPQHHQPKQHTNNHSHSPEQATSDLLASIDVREQEHILRDLQRANAQRQQSSLTPSASHHQQQQNHHQQGSGGKKQGGKGGASKGDKSNAGVNAAGSKGSKGTNRGEKRGSSNSSAADAMNGGGPQLKKQRSLHAFFGAAASSPPSSDLKGGKDSGRDVSSLCGQEVTEVICID